MALELVPDTTRGRQDKAGAARSSEAVITVDGTAYQLSEDALARRFEADFKGRLIYAHKLAAWFIYDESVGIWSRDQVELVYHWLREHIRELGSDLQAKWLKASVVNSVATFARRAPSLSHTGDELDANPWLLGTPTGVFDLRTGEQLSPSPDHFVTKKTSVSPSTDKPTVWLKFLWEATAGNQKLIDYLQRLAGYCLSGMTSEEVLVFMYGPGGNGKGVFMNAFKDVAGDYGRQAPMQVFLAANGDRHPTELANLFGARLVMASESPEGKRWDEERVKALTGNDAISARFMNRDFFEFVPQFKLLVASNHKPRIRTVDDAWRRRLHLVPFTCKPEKPDSSLKARLRTEYPAILTWAIEGAEWWSREGLLPPDVVREATDEYFSEEDVIGLWFAECCEQAEASHHEERRVLYASFELWCKGMGHAAANLHAVTRWFKQRGYEQDLKKSSRPLKGVRVKGDLL